MPTAPYLLVAFDVETTDPPARDILADVLAGFPANATPSPLLVDHLYSINVPASLAVERFIEVGMYLTLKDHQYEGVLRWVLQLCRIDEIATG